MNIKAIEHIGPGELARPDRGRPGEAGALDFGAVLNQSLGEVNKLQAQADEAVEALANGKGASLHETMIALEKADLSFRLMMQVRNKIVDAYREIVNMQV
jgi:flagellar hook-basal body complex protein FliE